MLPGIPPPPANRQSYRGSTGLFAHKKVVAILKTRWKQNVSDLEDLGVEYHNKPDPPLPTPFPPSGLFAEKVGFEVHKVQGCLCGTSFGKVLRVRPSADTQKWNLRVLHELAHAILRERFGDEFTHADVWALTLMLAVPRGSTRLSDLAHHVPAWVLTERAKIARKVGRAA